MTGGTPGRKILFADDDPFVVSLYRGKLTQAGFSVVVAKDGEEALRLLSQTLPELLVLDLNMPRVNGIDVLRYIREVSARPDLPVIVLSNACTQETLDAVRPLRPTKFLTKRETAPNHVIQQILALLSQAPAPETPDERAPSDTRSGGASCEAGVDAAVQAVQAAQSDEARREALLELYRGIQEPLRRLRQEGPLTVPWQVGSAAEHFFEDVYTRPAAWPAVHRAMRCLFPLLSRLGKAQSDTAAEPAPVLVFSENDEQRARLREMANLPGFQPLGVRRESTVLEMMAENPFRLAVWETSKFSAARAAWKRLRETAAVQPVGLLFVLPPERVPRGEEARDMVADVRWVATPVWASAFRLCLYSLRTGSAGEPSTMPSGV